MILRQEKVDVKRLKAKEQVYTGPCTTNGISPALGQSVSLLCQINVISGVGNIAKVPNPSGSRWLSMACTCLQKESLWAPAIMSFWESQGAAFPGAVHRTSMRLSGCPVALQTATSLVLGAGVINGVSEGLRLWSNEGETACPF